MKNRTNKILALLFAVSVFGIFSGSNEPALWFIQDTKAENFLALFHTGNEIIFNLSGGFIISLFFWFLLVHLPDLNHRKIIKTNLSNYYQNFKEDTIQILLWASIGTHDSDLPRELCDYKKFKQFFNENNSENWYAALNGLQDDNNRLGDLLVELELLSNEVGYALNSVKFNDPEVHSFLKRLSENIFRLKRSSVYSYDQVKYLGNFVFSILAQWSIIDGQREEDIIQKMIDRI